MNYRFGGKGKTMAIGSYPLVSLAQAREARTTARRLIAAGIDPMAERKAAKGRAVAERGPTFAGFARDYVEIRRPTWRNAKHGAQWLATLERYAFPVIGHKPPADISTTDVVAILRPIWHVKSETASRVQGRIKAILDAAKVQGLRSGDNPAQWTGHLSAILPTVKAQRVKHHDAMPFTDVPAFVTRLRGMTSVSAAALEFTILTAARTGQTIGATWGEIDLDAAQWIIPAARMKAGREHRVPLTERALAILEAVKPLTGGGADRHIFPGNGVRPLSNMAMAALLKRMGVDVTVHGFRSAFRDWAAECTIGTEHAAEMALAHAIGDKVEAAYRRGDLLDKRRRLMGDWADFCGDQNE